MNKKLLITLAALGIIVIILVTAVFYLSGKALQKKSSEQFTTSPTTTLIPTVPNNVRDAIPPSTSTTKPTTYPKPATFDALKKLLETPMKYKDITIQYYSQSDTFYMRYEKTEAQARLTFQTLIYSYGKNPAELNTFYQNLHPTLLPRKRETTISPTPSQ